MTVTPMTAACSDPFGPPPAVRLDDGGLVVDRLLVADPDVVAGARRAADPADPAALEAWCRTVLAIGARAAAIASGAEHADALGVRMEGLADRLDRAAEAAAAAIGRAVDVAADPARGTLRVAVDEALAGLAADVGALVAGEDAPLRVAVGRALAASTADAAARVERALQANTDQVRAALGGPAGPVEQLRAEIARAAEETRRDMGGRLAEVRDMLAEARAGKKALARAAAKGAPFEDAVVEAVTAIAAGTGTTDTVDATGTAEGAAARKTGDAVWHVSDELTGGLPCTVVVEAKSSRLSSARWRAELELARRNRSASAAIGVVDGVDLMPNGERLLVLGPTDLVVAWTPDDADNTLLAACLLLLRSAAASSVLAGAGRDPADLAAVGDSLRAALDLLTHFDSLDKAAAQTRKSVDETMRISAKLRALLGEHLGRAARLLAHGAGPVASPSADAA